MMKLACFNQYEADVRFARLKVERRILRMLTRAKARKVKLPSLNYSLFCFLPFWVSEVHGTKDRAKGLCTINVLALYTNWLLDAVADDERRASENRQIAHLVVVLVMWLVQEAERLGIATSFARYLYLNITALLKESCNGERSGLWNPYTEIWQKMSFGLLSVESLLDRRQTNQMLPIFRRFFAHYQMFDEWVDFFCDLELRAPNALVSALKPGKFGRAFWQRYISHGMRLRDEFSRDSIEFSAGGFVSVSDFCQSRAALLEARCETLTLGKSLTK
jgi:hypothetical protein